MDLGLSEQQQILRQTAREFLEGECPISLVRELEGGEEGYSLSLWKKMADLDWLGLALPPQYGGAGGSPVDAVVLFEEMGRALVPGPILPSCVMAAQTLLRAATEAQKADLLSAIARGDVIVTTALGEPGSGLAGGGLGLRAAPDSGGYVIDGALLFVPYAHRADYILCVAETNGRAGDVGQPAKAGEGDTLFLVEAGSPGVTANLLDSVAGYKQHEVLFQGVTVREEAVLGGVGQASGYLVEAGDWATVMQCAEIVGRAEKILEMVVEYAKNRVQFGRPIGSFQAVQHRCADLRVGVDGARLVTHQAAWKLAEGLPSSTDVSMAKACAGSLSRQAVAAGHIIFAGIAFTMEHDMQLYTMRSKIAEANLGDTDFHLDRLSEQVRL